MFRVFFFLLQGLITTTTVRDVVKLSADFLFGFVYAQSLYMALIDVTNQASKKNRTNKKDMLTRSWL